MVTLGRLQAILSERFGGLLLAGKHTENGQCCALELLSVARDEKWTDDPTVLRSFDLRPLNDIAVPDELRTKHMLPVIVAYDGSLDWPIDRQRAIVSKIAIEIVRQVVSELPNLSDELRDKCRSASDLQEARDATDYAAAAAYAAAYAAYADYADYAAYAAYAANAAYAAANAAYAAKEKVFIKCCSIWLDAAKSSQ